VNFIAGVFANFESTGLKPPGHANQNLALRRFHGEWASDMVSVLETLTGGLDIAEWFVRVGSTVATQVGEGQSGVLDRPFPCAAQDIVRMIR